MQGEAKNYGDWLKMQNGGGAATATKTPATSTPSAPAKTKAAPAGKASPKPQKVVAVSDDLKPLATAVTQRVLLALPPAGGTSAPGNKRNGPPLKPREIAKAVATHFGSNNITELRRNKGFGMATSGYDFDLKNLEDVKKIYRRHVGVLPDERFESGPSAINGIDVKKYFRPWDTFGIDPKTYDTISKDKAKRKSEKARLQADIKKVFAGLSKKHHPDHGGDPEVFAILDTMKKSILA